MCTIFFIAWQGMNYFHLNKMLIKRALVFHNYYNNPKTPLAQAIVINKLILKVANKARPLNKIEI